MQWLKNLKEGDKVIVKHSHNFYLDIVIKVTPKGFIKISNMLINPETGYARGWENTRIISIDSEEGNNLYIMGKARSLHNKLGQLLKTGKIDKLRKLLDKWEKKVE